MLLNLSPENLQHLGFLHEASDGVVEEFVNISLQFLTGGINRKIFRVAGQKLEVETSVVENAVVGLMQIFSEATKHKLTGDDLYDSLIALEFRESTAKFIRDCFSSKNKETRTVLAQCAPTLPAYDNLEWRLDMKLASRSLHQQITPVIRMKLHTSDASGKDLKVIQTDPVNLLHITRALDDALDEMKSNHVRRILRNIT